MIFIFLLKPESRELQVTFLNVGEGDSILIESPFGQNILIDGGPDEDVVRKLGEALPFWERKIDLLILTHPHSDHITGLNSVLERFYVDRVLYTGVEDSLPAYDDFLKIIEDKNILISKVGGFKSIEMGKDCSLKIIYPLNDISGKSFDNLNNSSIVSKLDCANKTFLFTGDIEKEAEEAILISGINIKSDVLKVAHHGSDTSNTEEFLNFVSPELAVIQSGEGNSFGHPSLRIVKRLERKGVQVLRNDIEGTIELTYKIN